MDHHTDVIVIGGGAAGMTAAIKASENHRNVLLLEKNNKPGRKVLAAGNGRCNLMNRSGIRYFGDTLFAKNVLNRCTPEALIRFFRHYGLIVTEEEDGRIYPLSYQSASVVSVLKSAMELSGVHLMTDRHVLHAHHDGKQFTVVTDNGDHFLSDCLIIACGGAAQPKLGGTTDGYHLLNSFGHTIITPKPALVPLETDRKSISGLSGIRIRCRVSIFDGNRVLHEESGEVLFTDYGVSGICIMQCARFSEGLKSHIELCLLDRAFENELQAMDELHRRRKLFSDFSPTYLLDGIIPAKLSYAVMKQAGIPMRGETARDLSDDQIKKIIVTAAHYRLDISGTRGFDYAQVTSGGADCSQFDSCTMSSRIIPGLFAAGEVLNVDGDCGGFNLMFAFASGMIAGSSV